MDELKRLTNNENEKKEKAKKRAAAPAKKAVNKKSKKKIEYAESDEDKSFEESIEEETEEEIVEDDDDLKSLPESDEPDDEDDKEVNGDIEKRNLLDLWIGLSPPVEEADVVQKWYGVIYYDAKAKPHLYVGKALKRFLSDEDGPVSGFEIECLKPHIGIGTILESNPSHRRDIEFFPVHNIIDGPLVVTPLKADKWDLADYARLNTKYETVVNILREDLFNNYH